MMLCVVALSGGLWAACAAHAHEIDLSAWTCREFQSAGKEDIGIILAWLDGYYRGEDDPPVIDTEEFVANAKKLGDYCAAHPDASLITATDQVFRGE